MKAAVKTLVDSIEKGIDYIKDNYHIYENGLAQETDFDYGTIYFEFETINKKSVGGEWDEILNETFITIKVNYVEVTNENNKVLTNLSNEVFNQLEDNYTNY